jgi:hypothetical protein
MNQLIQLKKATPPFLGVFVLVCLTLSPRVQAVVPPPDGGYPNFTTAEGQNALFSLTTGVANTAIGWSSLRSNTTGSYNTATGAATLFTNTGNLNTATGAAALFSNTIGFDNTASGSLALFHNTIGNNNTANGASALFSNTEGGANTASGDHALFSNTTGDYNTATGLNVLYSNTTGFNNTATGANALFSNIEGGANTANGFQALMQNTSGGVNTAVGLNALFQNTTGSSNTALGNSAGLNVTTASSVICIGGNVQGENVSNTCYIGNIWNQSGGSQAVYVNSVGKLGQMVSSRRFKDEIKPVDKASEAIYALKPVSFRYKPEIEPTRPLGFGLVAEEVEKINPDLVSRDSEGKPLSVRYDQVNAMLLNEFLKEHRTVQELKSVVAKQGAAAAQQQKQIEALTAGLQKVSAQLASRPAPQVVNNP